MITPADVRKLNEIDTLDLAAWEARIDKELARFDGQNVQVDVQGTSDKLRDKLVKMYRKAGWIVEVAYGDQRDPGTWLNFTA